MFLRVIAVVAVCLSFSFTTFAGTKSPARTALEGSNFNKVVSLINAKNLKTAEDLYLLGQALYKLGNSKEAHNAWTKCLKQNKEAGGKYEFLFAPGKKLTAAEKKALYNTFMKTYKSLNAAVISGLQDTAKSATRDASQKLVDASRADAREESLNKKAKATGKTVDSLQKQKALNNKNAQQKPVKKKSGSMPMIVGIVILLLIVAIVIFGKRSEDPEDEFYEASFGTRRYDVHGNDDYFMAGPFWYRGRYYHNEMDYYREHGHHYTNRMYLDNYDSYGRGQGRDAALDQEIMEKIEKREDLSEAAADAGEAADNLRADAQELENEASEAQEDIEELRETADILDEEPDFEDDEGAEEEPAFEDVVEEEEPEEEEPAFEDDGPEFEDDLEENK